MITNFKLKLAISFVVAIVSLGAKAQTVDVEALSSYAPAIVRQVYEVACHVKLDAEQQQALAKAFKAEDKTFVEMLKNENGLIGVQSQRELTRKHEKAIAQILNEEQQKQYWRGVYDKEASAEANAITNDLKARYDLTDQNCKFVRIAFYKIGLDSRVNDKMLAPKQAKKENEKLRRAMLRTIEDKGGIRVNDDMTITVVKPFDPNHLHK